MKLIDDFGVTALFGSIILIGSFVLLGIGVFQKSIDMTDLLPMLGSWVGGIVTGYIVIKAQKGNGNNNNNKDNSASK